MALERHQQLPSDGLPPAALACHAVPEREGAVSAQICLDGLIQLARNVADAVPRGWFSTIRISR